MSANILSLHHLLHLSIKHLFQNHCTPTSLGSNDMVGTFDQLLALLPSSLPLNWDHVKNSILPPPPPRSTVLYIRVKDSTLNFSLFQFPMLK